MAEAPCMLGRRIAASSHVLNSAASLRIAPPCALNFCWVTAAGSSPLRSGPTFCSGSTAAHIRRAHRPPKIWPGPLPSPRNAKRGMALATYL